MSIPSDPTSAATLFGNRFITQQVPSREFPENGMTAVDAMRLVAEDLALEGDPSRNLATFVTTWMEPEAQRLIAENLHRNFIDHAEYPRTAEIEQRCIRMLADLFHAPGETTGARTQGSSEAIMLGALSLKWNWRKRLEGGTSKACMVVRSKPPDVGESFPQPASGAWSARVGRRLRPCWSPQYRMTTRPSILPCFISSKTALMSPSSRVVTVARIRPRA